MRLVESKVLYLLFFISFTYWMSLLPSPISPLFIVEDLGASTFLLGTIMAITTACSTILRVPLGIASDRIGRWRMLIISLLITVLVNAFISLIPTYVWLYPLNVLRSVASAAFFPSANAIASNLARSPEERGRIMGRYMTSISLALVFGPFFCSLLVGLINYRQIYQVTALIALFGLVTAVIGNPYVKNSGYDKVSGKKQAVKGSLSRVVESRNMIALYLTMPVFYFTSLGVFSTLFAVYAKNILLYSPSFISLLSAIRGLTDTFSRIPVGHISDRFGRSRPLMLGLAMMVISLLCISTSTRLIIVLGFIIYGVGFGFRVVTMASLAGDSVPSKDVGLAMSLLLATTDIGNSLGSIFAGVLAETYFSPPTIFQISALILLLVLPILFIVKEPSLSKTKLAS